LFEHHVTFEEGNFAEFAHMVAFSVKGPRGFESRPNDIHEISNLMLLCPTCHKLIDDNPDQYTIETLRRYKKNHEERIYHLTGLRPEMKSSHLVVRSRIREQVVEVPFDHVLEAMAPRHPISKEGWDIDLTTISHGKHFTAAACEAIEHRLAEYFKPSGEVTRAKHISLFALAPIPVLMFLGHKLGNKVPLDLYQRHRHSERWFWLDAQQPVQFSFKLVRAGTEPTSVVLMLALSGPITLMQLPAEIGSTYNVYEVTPANAHADPTLIKSRADLENFRLHYQHVLAVIMRDNPGTKEIALLPAVPAPVAVLCGRELLPRVHPALRVYDHDKNGGYQFEYTINP
jgi:hypothetical protein